MSPTEDIADLVRATALAYGIDVGDPIDGPPRCFAGCGAEVKRIAATCSECDQKRVLAEHEAEVLRAWGTVPSTLNWADLRSQRMPSWVRDSAAVDRTREAAKAPDKFWWVTFVGEPGAGKTTLACALLRERMRPGARANAPPDQRAFTRRARFATAHDIVQERSITPLGEHVVSLDLAQQASILVLDEVGRGKDTHAVIFGLLHARHRERRPTIVTTPYASAADFSQASGDGGLARRVFDDAEVIVVRKMGAGS